MGMFDNYEPKRTLACPRCGQTLSGWQGKDGECQLFTYVEGKATPEERSAERYYTDEELQHKCLRAGRKFDIYTNCRCARGLIYVECETDEHGVWVRTGEPSFDEW